MTSRRRLPEALRRLVSVLDPDADVRSYREDFHSLWEKPPEKDTWILWDGTPDPTVGSVTVGNHLSAHVFATRLALEGSVRKITIVDAAGWTGVSPGVRSLFEALQLKASPADRLLPSVEVVRLDRPSELLGSLATRDRALDDERKRVVRQLVRESLVEPGDGYSHHSLTNLLGQLLLSQALGIPTETLLNTPAMHALATLSKSVGLVPGDADPMEKLAIALETNLIRAQAGRADAVILVDDQAKSGWASILSHLLGKKVEVFEDPLAFLDTYFPAAEAPPNTGCRPLGDRPLLFLDLRLFQESRRMEIFGAAVIQRLLDRGLCREPGVKGGWPRLSRDELEMLKGQCEDGSIKLPELLSLLPRAVAWLDSTLPVILFSSTGRRDALEPLRAFGTVISTVEKPRFFGPASSGFVVNFLSGLERAVREAAALLDLRADIADLVRWDAQGSRGGSAACAPGYWEIFIDESGEGTSKSRLVIGGWALGFRDFAAAQAFHNSLPYFGYARDDYPSEFPPVNPTGWPHMYKKGQHSVRKEARDDLAHEPKRREDRWTDNEICTEILSKLGQDVSAYFFFLRQPKGGPTAPADDALLSPRQHDNRHRGYVGRVLEFLLTSALPLGPTTIVSIYADRRDKHGFDRPYVEMLQLRFGEKLKFIKKKDEPEDVWFESLAFRDVRGILADVAGANATVAEPRYLDVRAVRLKNVCIPRGTGNQACKRHAEHWLTWEPTSSDDLYALPRQGHFVADILCNWRFRNLWINDVAKRLNVPWQDVLDVEVDGRFERALQAVRSACAGETFLALWNACEVLRANETEPVLKLVVATALVKYGVIKGLGGPEFVSVARSLNAKT